MGDTQIYMPDESKGVLTYAGYIAELQQAKIHNPETPWRLIDRTGPESAS